MKPNLFVFDCESTSLHGQTFAVGGIIIKRSTRIIKNSNSKKILARFQLLAEEGLPLCNDWVKANVLPQLSDMPTCHTLKELRTRFYQFYLEHRETCDIFSDVNFPVETNFLSAVHADDPETRQYQMPYPLFDIVNHVPLEIDRIQASGLSGLRKHHPLDDAMASAMCYLKNQKNK